MQIIKSHKLLTADNQKSLTQLVEAAIKDGYEPFESPGMAKEENAYCIFFQAVILIQYPSETPPSRPPETHPPVPLDVGGDSHTPPHPTIEEVISFIRECNPKTATNLLMEFASRYQDEGDMQTMVLIEAAIKLLNK